MERNRPVWSTGRPSRRIRGLGPPRLKPIAILDGSVGGRLVKWPALRMTSDFAEGAADAALSDQLSWFRGLRARVRQVRVRCKESDVHRIFGFLGVSPLDGELNLEGLAPFAQGGAIYRGNLMHMDRCDHRQYDAVSRCKHGRRDSI